MSSIRRRNDIKFIRVVWYRDTVIINTMLHGVTMMSALDRFNTKYICDLVTGCWIWAKPISSRYPEIYINGKRMLGHRAAYELFIAPIPEDKIACHKCDNTLCVNPTHLFLGTQKDNLRDMINKGREYNLPPMTLETHHNSRLTRKDWDDINAYQADYSSREIAIMYGVSAVHVRSIWAKYRSLSEC